MAEHRAEPAPTSEALAQAWSRRRILVAGGAGGGALLLLPGRGLPPVAEPELEALAKKVRTTTLDIVRPSDQLRLRVDLVNLTRRQQRLVAVRRTQASYLRVHVPAQHVDEQVTTTPGSPSKLKHRVAGETRLVFQVVPPIPLTLDAVLDWAAYALVTDPRGDLKPGATYPVGAPSVTRTTIELPEGLVLSPRPDARFVAQRTPLTKGGVTEEWTARLGTFRSGRVVEPTVEAPVDVRAIWTPGYVSAPAKISGSDPYVRPVSTVHRRHLVRATGDARDTTEYPGHEPARARRLWLGATGGWLDLDGSWDGNGLVAAWHHKATTGRDVSVTVVVRGYLAPFGVPASVATVSERVFAVAGGGDVVAQLEYKEYLVVGQTTVSTPRFAAPDGDRRSVFRDVTGRGVFRITRRQIRGMSTQVCFLPDDLAGNPVRVPYSAVDRAGNVVEFDMTAPFVDIESAEGTGASSASQAVTDFLNDPANQDLVDTPFGDQRVAFADEVEAGDGSTTLSVDSIVFGAAMIQGTPLVGTRLPAFVPAMKLARVRDDAGEALRGELGGAVEVEHTDDWITHGNGPANFGASFLRMTAPDLVGFTGDTDGLVAPSFAMGQFGQAIGQSVQLPSAGSTWDPAAALGSALAGAPKLLGSIALDWILEQFGVSADLADDIRLPRFGFDSVGLPELPEKICHTFDWTPPIRSVSVGGTRIFCVAEDLGDEGLAEPFVYPSSLEVHIRACVSLAAGTAGQVSNRTEISLNNVALQFPPALPMLAVYLKKVAYTQADDGKGDWDVDIAGIELVGPLNFVDRLVELLPDSLGSFDVDVLGTGIDAGLEIALPSLRIGAFSLANLRLGMGVDIPFDGDPVGTRFSLASRENPFTLTVMGVGGFASLEIEAAPHPVGVVRVEVVVGVVFELAVDVVVAKGSLSVSFSLGLEIEKVERPNASNGNALELVDEVTLTAAMELVGEVEILGLISISIELLLALEYRVAQRILLGTVSATVNVDAGIASQDVTLTFEQEFALGDGDGDGDDDDGRSARALPGAASRELANGATTFEDRYAEVTTWSTYCSAFA